MFLDEMVVHLNVLGLGVEDWVVGHVDGVDVITIQENKILDRTTQIL